MNMSLMPLASPPVREAMHSVLRRPTVADTGALAEATVDRQASDRMWDDLWPMRESQALAWVETLGEVDWPDGQPCIKHWLICDDEAPLIMGVLCMHWPDPGSQRVRIGYWLRCAARGRGLGTRAVSAAVQWLRREWPHAIVQMNISDANEPSLRLAQRCGFTLERQCAGVGRYTLALSANGRGTA